MPRVNTALWRDIMGYMRRRHAPICRKWFDELEPINFDSGLLQVQTSNSVQQKYLQTKCLGQFTEAAQSATGALVAVRFVHGDREEQRRPSHHVDGASREAEAFRAGQQGQHHATATMTQTDVVLDEIVISPDYAFENFVTGPNNRLAYAAAVAVANNPGHAYNPLFIHGGVGLGKTHLLQAICQQVLHEKPQTRIVYLSCDAFVSQFLDCVQKGQMSEFRHRYRHADLLVIDDIHFLANRERTQEEFFHTFNELYQSKRQIVLSSDSPPNEIPQLEERLVSRFQWGLVANVTSPSYETRVAIIKAKTALRDMEVPDDVVSYIATRIESNARELEGAITTIQGHAALLGKDVDLELAKSALGEVANNSAHTQITLQSIIDVVTASYNVKLSDLQSKRRHKSIAVPRQACMWLARRLTRFSLQEIGGYFGGRDHTTVMHALKAINERIEKDENFARQMELIEQDITRPQ